MAVVSGPPPYRDATVVEPQPGQPVGFFTDSSICIGCKACEVACKEWNHVPGDGRAFKCTLCYDRLKGQMQPACAQACPTQSIQFGPIDDLRARARRRLADLHEQGVADARLYGVDESDNEVGGLNAFFLLLDEPEVYGLPTN